MHIGHWTWGLGEGKEAWNGRLFWPREDFRHLPDTRCTGRLSSPQRKVPFHADSGDFPGVRAATPLDPMTLHMGLQSKLTQPPVWLESHTCSPDGPQLHPHPDCPVPILQGFYPLTWGRGLSGGVGASVIYGFGYDPLPGCGSGCHSSRGGSWWGVCICSSCLYYEFWNVCVLLVEWWEKLPGMVCCHQGVNELEELLL